MSRTKKGRKVPWFEYWSKRNHKIIDPGKDAKNATHRKERRDAKEEIKEQEKEEKEE